MVHLFCLSFLLPLPRQGRSISGKKSEMTELAPLGPGIGNVISSLNRHGILTLKGGPSFSILYLSRIVMLCFGIDC